MLADFVIELGCSSAVDQSRKEHHSAGQLNNLTRPHGAAGGMSVLHHAWDHLHASLAGSGLPPPQHLWGCGNSDNASRPQSRRFSGAGAQVGLTGPVPSIF